MERDQDIVEEESHGLLGYSREVVRQRRRSGRFSDLLLLVSAALNVAFSVLGLVLLLRTSQREPGTAYETGFPSDLCRFPHFFLRLWESFKLTKHLCSIREISNQVDAE